MTEELKLEAIHEKIAMLPIDAGDQPFDRAVAMGEATANWACQIIATLRAKLAEAERETEKARAMIPHPGDGSCEICGSVPSLPVKLCQECDPVEVKAALTQARADLEAVRTELTHGKYGTVALAAEREQARAEAEKATRRAEVYFTKSLDLEVEIADIRKQLRGLPESKLDGLTGLAAATMRAHDYHESRADAAEAALREALDVPAGWAAGQHMREIVRAYFTTQKGQEA